MKVPALKYVKFTRAKGKLYAYFNTGKLVGGKPVFVRLPPHGTPGFFDSYATMLGHRSRRAAVVMNIGDLIDRYEASTTFADLSQGTRRAYRFALDKVRKEFEKFPLDDLTRRHIRDVLEVVIEGQASRNMFIAVLSVLYKYARLNEWTEAEPTKDLPRYKTGTHEPWPDALLTAALAAENADVRLAVHLLYYTGQRLGDVSAMRWADIRNGSISLTQQKTGKFLSFPLHRDLAAELEATPKTAITILTGKDGRPASLPVIRKWLDDFATARGFKAVPHGLRKNAVNSLLQNGCTIAETASITGQTFQVVEHYAKGVNQQTLGAAAILKFEGNRA